MTRAEENVLLKKAIDGKQDAFRQLVELHENAVANTVMGLLGTGPAAEDVGQETFIRFYKSMKNFKGNSSLKTYITRIAINLSLNELKKRKRKFELFKSGGYQGQSIQDANFQNQNIKGWSSQEKEKQEDLRQLVQKALSYLDPKFQSVLNLRLLQGYSTKETAELLEIPLGTVLSRLSTAQKKLKKVLESLESSQ